MMWIALLVGLVVGGCTSTVTPRGPSLPPGETPSALDPNALFVSPAGSDSFDGRSPEQQLPSQYAYRAYTSDPRECGYCCRTD